MSGDEGSLFTGLFDLFYFSLWNVIEFLIGEISSMFFIAESKFFRNIASGVVACGGLSRTYLELIALCCEAAGFVESV